MAPKSSSLDKVRAYSDAVLHSMHQLERTVSDYERAKAAARNELSTFTEDELELAGAKLKLTTARGAYKENKKLLKAEDELAGAKLKLTTARGAYEENKKLLKAEVGALTAPNSYLKLKRIVDVYVAHHVAKFGGPPIYVGFAADSPGYVTGPVGEAFLDLFKKKITQDDLLRLELEGEGQGIKLTVASEAERKKMLFRSSRHVGQVPKLARNVRQFHNSNGDSKAQEFR